MSPPISPADSFLILDFVVGHRFFPDTSVSTLFSHLPSPSRSSSRIRRSLALRRLDSLLSSSSDALSLLDRARALFSDPDISALFPDSLWNAAAAVVGRDAARGAAAVGELKRLANHEWAKLPPSILDVFYYRIGGEGALETWANADEGTRAKLRVLVGEAKALEILGKLAQYMVPGDVEAVSAPCTNCATDDIYEANAQHQEELAKGPLDRQHAEKLVTRATNMVRDHKIPEVVDKATATDIGGQSAPPNMENHRSRGPKHSLMDRNHTAHTFEWNESDLDGPLMKRQLPTFERKHAPTVTHKTRKKWSQTQEYTLMEGVQKYGRGNWKEIKQAYPDVFQDRSTVDLKDKYRNMERYLC